MNETPYRPIACADHERLEFAALTRQWLDVRVDGVPVRLMPLDVYTRDGAEWLKAQNDSGEAVLLRLDRIGFGVNGSGLPVRPAGAGRPPA